MMASSQTARGPQTFRGPQALESKMYIVSEQSKYQKLKSIFLNETTENDFVAVRCGGGCGEDLKRTGDAKPYLTASQPLGFQLHYWAGSLTMPVQSTIGRCQRPGEHSLHSYTYVLAVDHAPYVMVMMLPSASHCA